MMRDGLLKSLLFLVAVTLLVGCGGEKVPPGEPPAANNTSKNDSKTVKNAEGAARSKTAAGTVKNAEGAARSKTAAGQGRSSPKTAQDADVASQDKTTSEPAQTEVVPRQERCQRGADLPCKVAILPFRNLSEDPAAGEALRKRFFNFFSVLNYDSEPISTIDQRLRESHLYDPLLRGEKISLDKICPLLGVEGVVRAEVTEYGKMDLAPQAQHRVTLKAELLHCQGGRSIWAKEATITDQEGGASLEPSGQAVAAIKTFISRQNALLLPASLKLCQEMVQGMPHPKLITDPSPRITLMVHNGAERFLHPGQSLRVALVGEAGMTGSWDIGSGIVNLPLREKSPGLYVGDFAIREKDLAVNTTLVARLATRSGVISRWLDILGGVNLGRLIPLPQMIHKDMTLTADRSPYLINPVLMVRPGATLTMEPGTVVWIRGKGFMVKGGIVVRGTADNPVRLQGAAPESLWDGLFLDQTQQPAILDHLHISGARYGINAHRSRITLHHGVLRNNTWGMIVDGGELELSASHIRDSEKTGLLIKEGKGTILASRIIGNRGGGIHLRNAQVRIEGNAIFGNTPWEMRQQGPGELVKAPRNWWGRTRIGEIPVQGAVDLKPLLEHPLPSTAVPPHP
ncbi:MAG: right-handed parallel beta-helix repeat-containing protein [Magnetococcales bacterium]|nr:right-handed parallel beta-helix repeat-containing protein [Magnetococcales bacterium]